MRNIYFKNQQLDLCVVLLFPPQSLQYPQTNKTDIVKTHDYILVNTDVIDVDSIVKPKQDICTPIPEDTTLPDPERFVELVRDVQPNACMSSDK
jgi:hypothetical protein